MKIIIFTTVLHLIKELQKGEQTSKNYIFLDSDISIEEEIYNNNENIIFVHHLQSTKSYEFAKKITNKFPHLRAIALSDTPTTEEGCKFLALGYKSYLHSFSNSDILHSAIRSVEEGNVYVYPDLMNFLVSQLNNKNINFNTVEHKNNNNSILDYITPKELEVLELLSSGMSNMAIAHQLNIAEITVKKHISSMFEKLNIKDRLSLALMYKNY